MSNIEYLTINYLGSRNSKILDLFKTLKELRTLRINNFYIQGNDHKKSNSKLSKDDLNTFKNIHNNLNSKLKIYYSMAIQEHFYSVH